MVLVVELKGGISMRRGNETDVGQLGRDALCLVLHAEVDQLTEALELLTATEPNFLPIGGPFHIVVHVFVDLWLWRSRVEVFELGMFCKKEFFYKNADHNLQWQRRTYRSKVIGMLSI